MPTSVPSRITMCQEPNSCAVLLTLQPWSMPRMEHQCDDQAGGTGWVHRLGAMHATSLYNDATDD